MYKKGVHKKKTIRPGEIWRLSERKKVLLKTEIRGEIKPRS